MISDQVAAIHAAIEEAISGGTDMCAKFDVIDGGVEKWVQFVDRTINAAYPHNDMPEFRVNALNTAFMQTQLIDWKAGKFATFEAVELDAYALAQWIDAYFVNVLNCSPGAYRLNVELEDLG